jgi:hypothetical protein
MKDARASTGPERNGARHARSFFEIRTGRGSREAPFPRGARHVTAHREYRLLVPRGVAPATTAHPEPRIVSEYSMPAPGARPGRRKQVVSDGSWGAGHVGPQHGSGLSGQLRSCRAPSFSRGSAPRASEPRRGWPRAVPNAARRRARGLSRLHHGLTACVPLGRSTEPPSGTYRPQMKGYY